MRRPQFSLKTLLWLMAVVAATLSGTRYGEWRAEQKLRVHHEQLEVEREDLEENQSLVRKAMDWMDSEARKRGYPIDWSWMSRPASHTSRSAPN
jgi:hypothetical protein